MKIYIAAAWSCKIHVHCTSGTSTKATNHLEYSWSCYTGLICIMLYMLFNILNVLDWKQSNCPSNQTKNNFWTAAIWKRSLYVQSCLCVLRNKHVNLWLTLYWFDHQPNVLIWSVKHQVPVDCKCRSKDTMTDFSFTESAIIINMSDSKTPSTPVNALNPEQVCSSS